MKKLLLIVVSCCFLLPVSADEEVYLDLNAGDIHQYKTFSPQIDNEKKEKTDDFDTDMVFHPFKYIKEDASELYSKKNNYQQKRKNNRKSKIRGKV